MCYNIQYLEDRAEAMTKRYGAEMPESVFKQLKLPVFMAAAFNHPLWPVIASEKPFEFQLMHWGLIPFWIKTREEADKIRIMTPNCVGETVFEKASFKYSILKRRCLVPATGFYEWHTIGKNKYPHYIYMKDRHSFSIAGLYDVWTDKETGEQIHSFSIITTPANSLLEKIHNVKKRMPAILPQDKEKVWLSPELDKNGIMELLKPYPSDEMQAHSISKLITSRTSNPDVPQVMEPYSYPELSLG